MRLGFLAAIGAFLLARPTLRSVSIGAAIAVAGQLFRIWAAGHLEKGREVTTSGPYRLTRHPLYVGSGILGVGFAIACNTIATTLLVLAYFVLTVGAAIRSEETHLTEKFGERVPGLSRRAQAGRREAVQRRAGDAKSRVPVRRRPRRGACAALVEGSII